MNWRSSRGGCGSTSGRRSAPRRPSRSGTCGSPRAPEWAATAYQAPAGLRLVDLTEEELTRADVVVVLTDHDAFDYSLVERFAPYIFDTRNRCTGAQVETI